MIEKKALELYNSNLEYIHQNHPKLFQKLEVLENRLQTAGAKYALEFKSSYFDVQELKSGNFLYNMDSSAYAKKVAKEINFNKQSSLFEGIIDYTITQEQINIIMKKELIDSDIRDVLPIMKIARSIAPKTSTMKTIDKFIFVGAGLGGHIVEIDNKIQASYYLVIEDDIELFRLSLFVTPYFEIAKHSELTLSIAQTDIDFATTFNQFMEHSYFNNRYLKYFHFSPHDPIKLTQIQTQLARQSQHVFPYDISLSKLLLPFKRIANEYKILNISSKFTKELKDLPVIVLAAGPSLTKHIQWLKLNQDKFIIIAVSAILNTLNNHNIKPDIVTQIDGYVREGRNCLAHLDGVDIDTFLSESLFIFGSHVPDILINKLPKERIFFLDDGYNYEGFDTIQAACVGSMSAALAVRLGFSDIYLLGLDLALDQETGATHSADHFQNNTFTLDGIATPSTTISLRDNIVQTKGNLVSSVFTTPDFLASVLNLSSLFVEFKDETQIIYNLTQGAFFSLATPTTIDEIKELKALPNKTELHAKLFNLLNSHSAQQMNSNNIKKVEHKLQNGQNILAAILKYQNKEFINSNKYMYDLLGLISDIMQSNQRQNSAIIDIFALYLRYTIPYIMDIENTKEVTKIVTHLKKIDEALIGGMLKIINKYIERLELFLTDVTH